MLTQQQRNFLAASRVGHLATADATGCPHVVPVCYAIGEAALYVTIDEKPKRDTPRPLKRVANIRQNPQIAVCVDRYDEDWTRLGWVLLRGPAEILTDGAEHDRAQALLRDRYAQYRAMRIEALPVIALRIARVTAWGDMSG